MTDKRYREIEQAVLHMYKSLPMIMFPINVFMLAKYFGIKLMPYSKMTDEEKQVFQEKCSEDGFCVQIETSPNHFEWRIYYDDVLEYCHPKARKKRIRYTILHELGHIFLGHTEHSQLAEAEANYFAGYAIAPPVLVDWLCVSHYMELSRIFNVTEDCAYCCMSRYFRWKYHKSETREVDACMLSLFRSVL